MITFALFCLVLLSGSAWAATSAIEGIVKDPNGRPINGADIRIEGKDGSSWNKIVKTDAKGHYIYTGLPAGGTYRVSLVVNSAIKASVNNVKTNSGYPTQLNFDLKPTVASKKGSASATKAKHMVWMPAQTGSNIGGKWVDVDDMGTAGDAGNERVEQKSGAVLRNAQSLSGTSGGGR